MTRTDTGLPVDSGSTLSRFLDRLDDFDVSRTLVTPDGVADAVDAVASEPAVGVRLPDGLGTAPRASRPTGRPRPSARPRPATHPVELVAPTAHVGRVSED
jgi:hypothetical protein